MKIRLLTLLFALAAPMLVFGQTVTVTGGALAPAGTTSGTVEFPFDVAGIAGSTLAGGLCPSTGLTLPDFEVPATLGYNTEITAITITNIQHTWASDLDFILVSPDGSEFLFSDGNGGSTGLDAAMDMNFSSTAADCSDAWTGSTSTVQPATGFQFEIVENTCGTLDAEFEFVCGANTAIFAPAVEGSWTLRVVDNFGGDTGTFDSADITFAPMTPPTETAAGVAVDLLACCADDCMLDTEDLSINLEAGECAEAAVFPLPGISGGASCKFCEEIAAPAYAVASGTVDVTEDADGNPTEVVISEEAGTNSYTITASADGVLSFDYAFAGSTFWDPFEITGPSGTIVNNNPTTGTVTETMAAGDVVTASVDGDGFADGSMLTLTAFQFIDPAQYPCFVLEQTGPTSGDFLEEGEYAVTYTAVSTVLLGGAPTADADADPLTAEVAITVNGYNGPVATALACNDQVNISADEDCSITIGADLFLEGGPYACYNDYEVNIWIYGNESNQTGNVNGATIDFGSLLGTHTYEVIDPTTGNSCWGEFTAEDKLAPSITCNDYTINCTENPINTPLVETATGSFSILSGVSNVGTDVTEYTGNVGQNLCISDLNVLVDAEITGAVNEFSVSVTSPSGRTATLWPTGVFGCGGVRNFIADDQGIAGLTCAQYQGGEETGIVQIFDLVGATYQSLDDMNGDNTQGTWTISVSGDVDVNAIELIVEAGNVGSNDSGDACGNTTFTFSDATSDNGCDGSTITRTWFATDAAGNQSEGCVQTITVEKVGIDDLLLPPALVELPCGTGTDPADIVAYFDVASTRDIALSGNCQLDVVENNEGYSYAYPTYNQLGCDNAKHAQKVDNNVCDIYATYTDQAIPACGEGCNGNVKVIRSWTLLDWCTNEQASYTQLIKSVDNEGPTFIVKDVTVSTDPWGCAANVEIPQPWELHDACTSDLTYTVSGPAGVTIVGDADGGYTALGAPKGVHTFTYSASDCCGNVTTADAIVTVLDGAPPVAVVKQNIVVSLTSSNTSNDGFAKIYVPSVDNGSHDGCTDVRMEIRRDSDNCDIRGNATYDGNQNHPNDANLDPDGGAYVKFCCADLSAADYDVDGDGTNDAGYVKVWLLVWDDANMNGVIGDGTGEDNFNESWAYVKVEDKLAPQIVCPADVDLTCDEDYTDIGVTGSAQGFASCGAIDVEYNDIIVNLNSCNEGFVRRRWNIAGQPGIFCDQTINLAPVAAPDPIVSFSQVRDADFDGCPEGISTGEPTWTAGPCDVLGYSVETDTFRFEDGACYKLVNHYTVINWCDYDPNSGSTEGIWEHTQVIKVTDNSQPVIENCEDMMFEINDHGDSDNDGNVCEAKITLTNVATDPGSGTCPTSWLKWQVTVDLWADGTLDYEYTSFIPGTNFNTDANQNGIVDQYVAPTANGGTVSIPLVDIEGSMSNHKVNWSVTDGCNNVRTCSQNFMVVDKKAPTPYCVSLSTAVMEMGADNEAGVELWAEDFNIGSFDNCTAQEDLLYSFSGDSYVPNRTFTCADVANSPVEVQMYVWDEKGNNDFCTVFLTIVDNQDLCGPGSRPDIEGGINTEAGTAVSDVETSLDADFAEYPKADMSDDAGHYAFENNVMGIDYAISAEKDVDYLNGVSTLDLVKIQRHILGLESLDSPYKLIAADINADNQVKVSDLSQLRKLILGVITDLPTNDSWRFVDGAQVLDMDMDLADVVEVLEITNLSSDMMSNDMVGVKVGDVTGNAVANLQDQTIEVRSNNAVDFVIDNREVTAGETVEVAFTSADFADVFGYQFTMELNGLEFAGVQSGAVAMNAANVGVLANNVVTVSYSNSTARTAGSNEAVFTATFKATQNGSIANMIEVSSKVASAEAYVGESLEIRNVTISTRGDIATVDATELFQNEPNPFKELTVVGFNLVDAAPATLTVFDVTGKLISKTNIDGVKGYNSVNLNANQLGTSGVLYYTLESGEFTATKKMIIIE